MDHNPHLSGPHLGGGPAAGANKGGPAGIELPEKVQNVPWQTRPAVPTDKESALADALQAIFAAEIYELTRVVEELNRRGVAVPGGASAWTEETFRAEMARLGA